jgi:hypothetical protein
LIQVPTISVKEPANILKHPKAGPHLLHSSDKGRKSISRVIQSKLVATDAEWLAGWTTDDDIGRRKSSVSRKELLNALSVKICIVCGAAIGVYFVSQSLKARGFKPQREAPTSCEEIQNTLRPGNRRTQNAIRHGSVGFGLQEVFGHGRSHSGIWYADSPSLRSFIQGREKCLVVRFRHLIT